MSLRAEARPGVVRLSTGGSYREFLTDLRDPAFRAAFLAELRAAPFPAFCFETPPLTRGRDRPFECRLVDSPMSSRIPADPEPFRALFDEGLVVVFPSLGGDSRLVAPCPRGPTARFAHLARFVREGDPDQVDAVWVRAAEALEDELADTPRWFSTAGLGVAWLHLRIDTVPKYYRTAEYRT